MHIIVWQHSPYASERVSEIIGSAGTVNKEKTIVWRVMLKLDWAAFLTDEQHPPHLIAGSMSDGPPLSALVLVAFLKRSEFGLESVLERSRTSVGFEWRARASGTLMALTLKQNKF